MAKNKKSIQILRGSRNSIAENNSNERLIPGQLLYNKTDNYLTVGNIEGDNLNKQPITTNKINGYFTDADGIQSSKSEDNEYYIGTKSDSSYTLQVYSAQNMELYAKGNIELKTDNIDKQFVTTQANVLIGQGHNLVGDDDSNDPQNTLTVGANNSYKNTLTEDDITGWGTTLGTNVTSYLNNNGYFSNDYAGVNYNNITSGNNNKLIGNSANAIVSGSNNILAGGTNFAGGSNISGQRNIVIRNSYSIVSGQQNIVLDDNDSSYWSQHNIVSGRNNILLNCANSIIAGRNNGHKKSSANYDSSDIQPLNKVSDSIVVGENNYPNGNITLNDAIILGKFSNINDSNIKFAIGNGSQGSPKNIFEINSDASKGVTLTGIPLKIGNTTIYSNGVIEQLGSGISIKTDGNIVLNGNNSKLTAPQVSTDTISAKSTGNLITIDSDVTINNIKKLTVGGLVLEPQSNTSPAIAITPAQSGSQGSISISNINVTVDNDSNYINGKHAGKWGQIIGGNYTDYTVGNNITPIYLSNGLPQAINYLGANLFDIKYTDNSTECNKIDDDAAYVNIPMLDNVGQMGICTGLLRNQSGFKADYRVYFRFNNIGQQDQLYRYTIFYYSSIDDHQACPRVGCFTYSATIPFMAITQNDRSTNIIPIRSYDPNYFNSDSAKKQLTRANAEGTAYCIIYRRVG